MTRLSYDEPHLSFTAFHTRSHICHIRTSCRIEQLSLARWRPLAKDPSTFESRCSPPERKTTDQTVICTSCRDLFLSWVLVAICKDNHCNDFLANLVSQKRSLAQGSISIPMRTPIILLQMKTYLFHQPVKRYTAEQAEIAAAILLLCAELDCRHGAKRRHCQRCGTLPRLQRERKHEIADGTR